jgi:hypothetical protein
VTGTTYTADAVSLLCYLVDGLPPDADAIFAEAEAGQTVIESPGIALAETLYAVSRDKDVRGITLSVSPATARETLVDTGPIAVAPIGADEIEAYATISDRFSLHDGLVVASHRVRDTMAVLTTDGEMTNDGVPVVWD